MILTSRQREIIIGNILGDGGVYFPKGGNNAYYYVKQCKEHKEYVHWLFDELKSICPSAVKERKDNKQLYFYSSPFPELTVLKYLFYSDEGKKIVPTNIKDLLISPLSLAVWFMDDGTLDYRLKDHCAFHLCTNCFTREEGNLLVDVLKKNFGIIASVHYTLCRGKRHTRVYIGAKGRDQFIKLVSPYVLDCFKYKLPEYRGAPQRLVELSSTDSK